MTISPGAAATLETLAEFGRVTVEGDQYGWRASFVDETDDLTSFGASLDEVLDKLLTSLRSGGALRRCSDTKEAQ